jgi:hypothetical protein
MKPVNLPTRTSAVWDLLHDFPGGTPSRGESWQECLRMSQGAIGEIHLRETADSNDWRSVPLGHPLKVLMLRDANGFRLRWADSRREKLKCVLGVSITTICCGLEITTSLSGLDGLS